MSRILRRPMFRGGPVSSYGNGIASGLAEGGRVGYVEGGSTSKDDIKQKIIEQVMIEFPDASLEDQMKIAGQRLGAEESFLDNSGIGSVLKFGGNLALDTASSVVDPLLVGVNTVGRTFGYNPGLSANKGVEFIKKGIFGENAEIYDPNDPDRDEDANPDVAEFFAINTSAENTGDRREREAKELLKVQKEKNEKKAKIIQDQKAKEIQLQNYPEKSDKEVMQEYMDMFKESLGGDKDELNRQRYLEIAKFGANLMAQPGGQSLGESVGKAGSPALEGLSKIDAAERAGDRQAKTLGFQAALRKLEPGQIEKNIKDLSKYMSKDEAIKVATRQGEATNNLTKRKIIDGYAADIQSSPGAPSSAVIVKGLAETIFDYTVKEGKNISDFAPLTEKTTIEKDKLYYDKEGKIYKGKDDGTYIKVELSTSNE